MRVSIWSAVPVDRKKKDQMENIVAVKKIGIVKSERERKIDKG